MDVHLLLAKILLRNEDRECNANTLFRLSGLNLVR